MKLNSKELGFSNKKSFQEFKDDFNFKTRNREKNFKIFYTSKNKSEADFVLKKYVQIFKSFSSQRRKSNYATLNKNYSEIISNTSSNWINSLYQLTEFLNDKKIYGQTYDIPLMEKDVILREYGSNFNTESIIIDYENDYETNLRNSSINHVSLNFIHYKKRLEKLNYYILKLGNFSDYDLSNNYISIILPELKNTKIYSDIDLINKKLSLKSLKEFNRNKINLLNRKEELSKSFRETVSINLNHRKDLVTDTLLAFENYEKYLPEFVEKFITYKKLGEELQKVNSFANKLKIYNGDHKYNQENFSNPQFSRNFSLKKFALLSSILSMILGFLIIIIKENF